MRTYLDTAIAAIRQEFSVVVADCPRLLDEVKQLRQRNWRLDCGYKFLSNCADADDYEHRSLHILVRHRISNRALGTVRLVLPSPEAPDGNLPMRLVCDPETVSRLPQRHMAEISGFIITRTQHAASPASQTLLRLSLMRGLVLLSHDHGLTHLCAVLEPSLCRLLQASGIHFAPVGPLVDHHGIRQLVFCQVDELLGRVRQEHPAVWDFITDGGRLHRSPNRLHLLPQPHDAADHGSAVGSNTRSTTTTYDATSQQ